MQVFSKIISNESTESALNWVLEHSKHPNKELDPCFDIFSDDRQFANKIRRLYWFDTIFWEKWLEASCMMNLVKQFIEHPLLIKHAAFIKRGVDESFIPPHQDIVLWEKKYKTATVFWVSLTDAAKSNGGIFYYPDSSKIYKHSLDIQFPNFKYISKESGEIDYNKLTAVDARRSDVLVWNAMDVHGSFENKIGKLRVGMPMVFVERSELGSNNVIY